MINEDNIDRRLVVKFTTLNEKYEKLITDELISFIYYYYLQTGIYKKANSNAVFEYYYENIKKPRSIHELLEDFNVQVDAVRYIEETYNMIVLIMQGLEDDRMKFFIDESKEYKREEFLGSMIYLLDKYKANEKVKDIIGYLERHGMNQDNITDDYIKRIVNKVYDLV